MPPQRPGRGWTLPGYKYLGPFNPLNSGVPTSSVDRAARRHDHAYSKYIDKGKNPYTHFNEADRTFLGEIKDDNSWGGLIGYSYFSAKQALAPTMAEGKRGAEQSVDQLRAETSSGSAKAGDEGGGGTGGGMMITVPPLVNGATFGHNTITTHETRPTWFKAETAYQTMNIVIGTTNGPKYVHTHWLYHDFNIVNAHFSPHDWQKMVMTCEAIRPKRITYKMQNLEFMIHNTLPTGVITTPFPTAILQVAIRKKGEVPYVHTGMNYRPEGGEIIYSPPWTTAPWRRVNPNTYGYMTRQDSTTQTMEDIDLYVVEHGIVEQYTQDRELIVQHELNVGWAEMHIYNQHMMQQACPSELHDAAEVVKWIYQMTDKRMPYSWAPCAYRPEDFWMKTNGTDTYIMDRRGRYFNDQEVINAENTHLEAHTAMDMGHYNNARSLDSGTEEDNDIDDDKWERSHHPKAPVIDHTIYGWEGTTSCIPKTQTPQMSTTRTHWKMWELPPTGMSHPESAMQPHVTSDPFPMVLFRLKPIQGQEGSFLNLTCNATISLEIEWETRPIHHTPYTHMRPNLPGGGTWTGISGDFSPNTFDTSYIHKGPVKIMY